jgi:hypothetical protein
MGSLLPAQGQHPTYSQLYIYEPRHALQIRIRNNIDLRPDTLKTLQDTIIANNPYAGLYASASQILKQYPNSPDSEILSGEKFERLCFLGRLLTINRLVSRVFHMKARSIVNEIAATEIFGRAVAHVYYTIEFQKGGLPHTYSFSSPGPTNFLLLTISTRLSEQIGQIPLQSLFCLTR